MRSNITYYNIKQYIIDMNAQWNGLTGGVLKCFSVEDHFEHLFEVRKLFLRFSNPENEFFGTLFVHHRLIHVELRLCVLLRAPGVPGKSLLLLKLEGSQ